MTNRVYTTEQFINKATSTHDDRYDYTKTIYTNAKTPVKITCRLHGDFHQLSSNHFAGAGCPECAREKELTTLRSNHDKMRGVSRCKPLNPDDYATKVIKDLGMRDLANRKMRYVELACSECGAGFELSCDNAKRRQEHLCPSCKVFNIK